MSTPTREFDIDCTVGGRTYECTATVDICCAGCGNVTVDDLVVLPPMYMEPLTEGLNMVVPAMHRECLGLYLSKLFKVDAP